MAQPQDDSNKYLEDSFPQQNPNLDIESSAMLSGGGERGGLGTIFQMLNDLATENSSDSVLVANSNANFSQILEEATSAPEVSLSSQEVINQFGDCSVVTSSQTYPSCRFEGLVNEEAFDQNQTNQNLRDDGSDVSTSRLEFGSNRDEKYWERRRKNNMAAKKSRDARRVRENQLRLKVLCLENANQVLRTQVEKERQKNKELTSKVQDLEKKLQTSDRLSTS